MNKISYSQISLYNECPFHWKLRYVDKILKSESNIYLIFGRAMHEALQKYITVMYEKSVRKADLLNLEVLLQEILMREFQIAREDYGENPCTLDEIKEFFDDGVLILKDFKKNRAEHFSRKGYELLGCEIPLEVELQKNINWVGYIDVAVKNIATNVITIYDIKTSTMGWNKWMRKDKNKTQQLLLYKQFYSKQYNHPLDKIEVEYFIVKRKLRDNVDFPQKRVQKFLPPSGAPSMNKVTDKLLEFIDKGFNDDGSYTSKEILPTPNKKSCRFCEFNRTNYCKKGVL